MPDRVEPALAELKAHPPKGEQWSWELKWDGYRLAVHIEPQGVRILTRGGHDWTHRFPDIAEAARALGPATMIIDGEAVVLDQEGRPDFGLLQQSLGASGKAAGNLASDAILYAFDLTYLDGHDLRGVEYRSRRNLLEDTLVRKLNLPHWTRWFGVEHRCLVPVTSFAEPDPASQETGGKVPNAWFARDEAKSLMFFAGIHVPLWERPEGQGRPDHRRPLRLPDHGSQRSR